MTAAPAAKLALAGQAVERWLDLGLFAPHAVAAPLTVAAAGGLSRLAGWDGQASLLALSSLAWMAATLAVYSLARAPLGRSAWQAAAVAAFLPTWSVAVGLRGEPDRLVFWALPPLLVLAVDAFRRKPTWLRASAIPLAVVALVLARPGRWILFDALAAAGWAAVAWLIVSPSTRRDARLAAAGLGAILAGAILGSGAQQPSTQDRARPFERLALSLELSPLRRSARDLIDSPFHPEESLLWLRALGSDAVTADRYGKFHRELDCLTTRDEQCVFVLSAPAGEAVVVSRPGFEGLRPVRGPLDVERLERYIAWAGRPELLTLERPERGRLTIRADLGPDSVILVRQDFSGPWTVEPASVTLHEDPIGYLVLDPGQTDAPVEVSLIAQPNALSLLAPPQLRRDPIDMGEFPVLRAEGLVDAQSFAGPPFRPGAYLSLFGSRFEPEGNDVALDGAPLEKLYESRTQINVRLPQDLSAGSHELTVTSRGRATEPYPFEVTP
ncbi:MAG: hypothetical protein GC160_29765 [Acidobacteria bacterium]|nr:hypothetical protein [Acidobacteriota bacterium]